MPRRRGGRPYLFAAAGALLAGAAGVTAFVATRPQDDPPPPTTTTTTFPYEGYVSAIAASVQARVAVDEPGARCIAEALVAVMGEGSLQRLAEAPDPVAGLTTAERELVLRTVVGCVDPLVAQALLGGGTPASPAPLTLPEE